MKDGIGTTKPTVAPRSAGNFHAMLLLHWPQCLGGQPWRDEEGRGRCPLPEPSVIVVFRPFCTSLVSLTSSSSALLPCFIAILTAESPWKDDEAKLLKILIKAC